jgi:hypothetical protein
LNSPANAELTQSISKVMLKLSFCGCFGSPTTMSVGRVVEFDFLQCVRACGMKGTNDAPARVAPPDQPVWSSR